LKFLKYANIEWQFYYLISLELGVYTFLSLVYIFLSSFIVENLTHNKEIILNNKLYENYDFKLLKYFQDTTAASLRFFKLFILETLLYLLTY